MKEFTAYMVKNLKYPQDARKQKVEGTVFVKFVVRSDGTVDATEIVKGIGGGCDEEALRVVVNSGKWTAGVKDGRAVSTLLTLPVEFKL
jgi:TonB family protein